MTQLLREGGRAFANVLEKLRVKSRGTKVRLGPRLSVRAHGVRGAIFLGYF